MKKESLINIVSVIVGIGVVILIGFIVNYGVDKEEKVECYQLQSQSMKYEAFFATEWQKDMCRAHGFDVNNW